MHFSALVENSSFRLLHNQTGGNKKQLMLTDVHPHNRPAAPAGKDKRTWPQTGVTFVWSNVLRSQDIISEKCPPKQFVIQNYSYLTSATCLTALTGRRPAVPEENKDKKILQL